MLSFRGYSFDDPVLGARLRALCAIVAFAAGLLIARESPALSSVPVFLAAGILAITAMRFSGIVARALLIIAMSFTGLAVGISRWHETRNDDLRTMVDSGAFVDVDLRVLSQPGVTRSGYVFEGELVGLHDQSGVLPASGTVLIRVLHPEAPRITPGNFARVNGIFETVSPPRNPGERDRRFRAAENAQSGTITLRSPTLIESRDASDVAAHVIRLRCALKARAAAAIELAAGSPPDSKRLALLAALFTGERRGDHAEVNDLFVNTGLAHALSISGFHIAVLAALLGALMTFVGERGMPMFLVFVALMCAYLAIVVPSAPVNRSVAMVLAVGVIEWSGRRYDRVTVLLWIALGLLIVNPSDLFSLGYQLSVGLTALLMWSANAAKERMFGARLKGLVPRPMTLWDVSKSALATSVSSCVLCAIVSMPLIVYHTGRITPLAALASVIISPLIVVLLVMGYLALMLGMLIPMIAHVMAAPLGFFADLTLQSASLFDSVPGSSLQGPTVTALWVFAATVTAIIALTRRVARSRLVFACGALGTWALFGIAETDRTDRDVVLKLDCLDVGSGTCMIVRSGGDALLFDCGSMRQTDGRVILNACRALGVSHFPIAIISHPDSDHFGLLPQLVGSLPIDQVAVSQRFLAQADTGATATCVKTIEAANIPIRLLRAGDSFELGELHVSVISPDTDADFPNDNDHSLVLRFDHQSFEQPVLVLTGDVQDDAIRNVRDRLRDQPLIIEAPHHGSARSAAIDWMRALNPRVIVQSTDSKRLNDPRWLDVRRGSAWLSTAASGALSLELTRDGRVCAAKTIPEP